MTLARVCGALSALLVVACQTNPGAPPPDAGERPDGALVDAPRPVEAPHELCARRRPRAAPALPTYAQQAPVEVLRDELGVPHLYARNDEDALFASGYLQASDRLFQMEFLRRTASGTAAEAFGPDLVEQDRLLRLFNLGRWGRESADRTRREHPQTARLLDAWTAGVNRRVREVLSGAAPRPPGFRGPGSVDPQPWTTDDVYTVGRLILFQNSNQLQFDLLASVLYALLPQSTDLPLFDSLTQTFTVPDEERPSSGRAMARAAAAPRRPRALPSDLGARLASARRSLSVLRGSASNNWAVDGRHTFNGRPLIAGDPHQSLRSPGVFWAHHLNSADAGGTLDVVGFGFVGTPGVQLGHNRRVAWTATTAYPDTMDVWRVEADETSAQVGGRSVPVVRCEETLLVRGAPSQTLVVEEVPGYGVLLPPSIVPVPVVGSGERMLFNDASFRGGSVEADVFVGFDRAASTDAFEADVRRMEHGAFNWVAADARGIMYRSHVLVPDRGVLGARPTPNRILDGSDPRSLWTGAFLGDDQQPHSRGGRRGFLATANNEPFGFTRNGRTDDDPWYYGVWFDPGARASRIESELARLTASGGVTVAQMQTLQLDTHNLLAERVLPALFEAYARVDTDSALSAFRGDARLAALVSELRGWNRRMDRDLAAPVIYEGLQNHLARQLFADDLPVLYDAIAEAEPIYVMKLVALTVNRAYPAADRYMQQGRDVLLLRALAQTRDWLAERFGDAAPSRYTWGAFHRSRFGPYGRDASGEFAREPAPTAGSTGTVNVSDASFFREGRPTMFHESGGGAVYRMVASFDEDGTPSAVVNIAGGNGDDRAGPDWEATQADWLAGRYRPLRFRRAAVEAGVRERRTINP